MDVKVIGISAALGSAASWAIGSILFKRIGETASPLAMTMLKGLVSVVLLGLVLLFIGFIEVTPYNLMLLVFSGLLGIAIGDTLFFAALRDLGPVALVVFFMLGNIFTAIIAIFTLGQIPSHWEWVGILMTVGGVAAVIWKQITRDERQQPTKIRGIIYGTLFMLSMSLSTIVAAKVLESMTTIRDSFGVTFIRMAAGLGGIFLFGLTTNQLRAWTNPFKDLKIVLFFIGSVCVVTFGGFWLSTLAIQKIDVAIAQSLGATEPLFTLPLAFFFLREKISIHEITGTAMTVIGVIILCIK